MMFGVLNGGKTVKFLSFFLVPNSIGELSITNLPLAGTSLVYNLALTRSFKKS